MTKEQYNYRIAVRLQAPERERLEQLIFERKFKNLSQAIRAAITEFLNEQGQKNTVSLEENKPAEADFLG